MCPWQTDFGSFNYILSHSNEAVLETIVTVKSKGLQQWNCQRFNLFIIFQIFALPVFVYIMSVVEARLSNTWFQDWLISILNKRDELNWVILYELRGFYLLSLVII